ncbi:hypothetical protein D3C80_1584870 [compost metagenome]
MQKEVAWIAAQTIAPLLDLEADPVGFQQAAMVPVPLGQLADKALVRFQRAEHVQHARPLGVYGADIQAEQRVQMVGQFQLIGDKHVFNRRERQHAGGDFGQVGGVIVGHQRFFLVGSHGLSTLGINGCLGKRPAWRSGDI